MEKYDFYKDERVIYWERTNFSVKSETYDDAVKTVEQLMETELDESDIVSIEGGIIFFDTCQPITVEQNKGIATVRIYNSNDQLVVSNSAVSGDRFDLHSIDQRSIGNSCFLKKIDCK